MRSKWRYESYGPRPERPELELDLKANIDNYELRYLVKPGLSGWAK